MRMSDWSSDVCSSDLVDLRVQVSICRCKWRSKCCRLRIDTIEVRAGAIAVEKLKLLGIGQTIAQPSVDLGLEHRHIVKTLARCQKPGRDDGDGRRLAAELDFRRWACRSSGFCVSCRCIGANSFLRLRDSTGLGERGSEEVAGGEGRG